LRHAIRRRTGGSEVLSIGVARSGKILPREWA
jgi:hypothetical protein